MRNIIIFFIILFSQISFASDFPEGWRLPNEKELSTEPLRNDSPDKYIKAQADFNGDGKDDYAYLLKNTKYNGYDLLIKLSKGADYEWKVLDGDKPETKGHTDYFVMGISVASKSKISYQTACAKGYWECGKDEPESVSLELPGLNYFMFESASSLFYWNQKKQEFMRVWLSD